MISSELRRISASYLEQCSGKQTVDAQNSFMDNKNNFVDVLVLKVIWNMCLPFSKINAFFLTNEFLTDQSHLLTPKVFALRMYYLLT